MGIYHKKINEVFPKKLPLRLRLPKDKKITRCLKALKISNSQQSLLKKAVSNIKTAVHSLKCPDIY